jgi:D-arginine utilization repressor
VRDIKQPASPKRESKPRATRARRSPKLQLTPDLGAYDSIAEAITALLHPHAEVVIHDVVNDRIVGIWNAFSKRTVGDPSNLMHDPELRTMKPVIGPYDKAERDGTRVKSVSAALYDAAGNRTGLLCVNLSMSQFDAAIEMLRSFSRSATAMPDVLFKGDLREQVNLILRDELLRLKKSMSALTREDRRAIVKRLDEAHIFQARNAGPLVAATLGLGRANLYHILAGVRGRSRK